ncbi:hypothetical protein JOB18_002293 [Solea senegalensis]|uniref:Uncharacterized protein n=1 Tax=Solea senegalensis TaxID=28829 RepID=A0AAV6SUL5_SOLSE|nr:hypothetical protein JOB18_002293 [Solea senegalensis]
MGADLHPSLTLLLQKQHVKGSHYRDKAVISWILPPLGFSSGFFSASQAWTPWLLLLLLLLLLDSLVSINLHI